LKKYKTKPHRVFFWPMMFCKAALSPCYRAYDRGVQEVHCSQSRDVLGPWMMKVRTLSFSVIKPKIDGRFLQLQSL